MTSPSPLTEEMRRTVHDLNNALTTILANAQLAAACLGAESRVTEELDDIIAGARTASELARRLRAMARELDGAEEGSE